MKYICPVCGYNNLTHPPADWTICPSCLTEFGYNDVGQTYDELRADWIATGAKWESSLPKPPGWDPIAQLRNIGYKVTAQDKEAIERPRMNSIGSVRFSAEERPRWLVIESPSSITESSDVIRLVEATVSLDRNRLAVRGI